jgi:hypothetical protein
MAPKKSVAKKSIKASVKGKKKEAPKGKKELTKHTFLVSYIDQSSDSGSLFPAYLIKALNKRQAINYVANTDRNSRNFLVAEKMTVIEPEEDECETEEEENEEEESEHLCPDCQRELGMDSGEETDDLEDLDAGEEEEEEEFESAEEGSESESVESEVESEAESETDD